MKNDNNSDHNDNNDKWHLSLRVYSTTGEKITRGRRNGTYLRCQYWQNSQYRTYNSTLVLGEQDICKYAM